MSDKAATSTRYRIGYALAPKKVQSFIQPSLINLAKERGIDLVPVVHQLNNPDDHTPPFHCIIHKLSDPQWINLLQQFLSRYPNLVVIDHPEAIQRLHSRATMLQVVNELKITHQISLQNPKQVFVESPESLFDSVPSKGMCFPVIAKPLVADGSESSHQMFLVLNEEGLRELKLNPPFVLQEFVNHGGVIFKVYVAGEHVQCVKRKSLPDISEEKLGVSVNLLPFARISNFSDEDQSVDELIEAAEFPPSSFVTEVATELRQALKLNLFNFDMIKDSRDGDRYLIIDINYFPGYAKIPCYETMLTDFFLDVVQQKQSGLQ